MRYFSKHFLRSSDLKIIRKSLLETYSHRVVDYGGNWLEVAEHEKLVRTRGTGQLWEEYQTLVERTKDVWINFYAPVPHPYNYEWDKLSVGFKRHMRDLDERMYHEYYSRLSKGVSEDEYNRRLDRLSRYMPGYTDADFERYVLLGNPIPTPEYKKALDSARRAYKQVVGLLRTNINDFTEFVTLTFAHEQNRDKHRDAGFDYVDGFDFEIAKQAFTQWARKTRQRMNYAGYDLKYIAVWEMQKNGAYHFHLATNTIPASEKSNNPDWLDYDNKTRQYINSIGLNGWKHGKSDVQRISSHEKMSTYLSKYIVKSIYNIADNEELIDKYKGQKKYFVSGGLKKPEVIYADDFDDLVSVEPYEREHHNSYNQGKIKTKIYTLIKKDAIDLEGSTTSDKTN